MTGLFGLRDSLGSKEYKPFSSAELKKIRTDNVRDKLCLAIGRSVYYYQTMINVIKEVIYLHFCQERQTIDAFNALLHEAKEQTIFNLFAKMYTPVKKDILLTLEQIRNSIVHSYYLVSEYDVWSEKPRMDKTKNEQLLKKGMNLNIKFIMNFSEITLNVIEAIRKISRFKQDKNKEHEFSQIIAEFGSLNSKIQELKSNIEKTNKISESNFIDRMKKALIYGM